MKLRMSGVDNSRALWHIIRPDSLLVRRQDSRGDGTTMLCGNSVSGAVLDVSANPHLRRPLCTKCSEARWRHVTDAERVLADLGPAKP